MTDRAHRVTLREYGTPTRLRAGAATRIIAHEFQHESRWWQERLGLARAPFVVQKSGGGEVSVRAEGVTGFIHVGDIAVDVRPKFLASTSPAGWREALWYIVAVLDDATLGALTTAATGARGSLPDLLARILVTALERGALEGFPRGYVEACGTLPALRGRLDLTRISALVTRPQELPCVYDEYSLDIPLNRLLRWAALTLVGAVQSPRLARTLTDGAQHFAGVSHAIPGPVEADMLQLPSQFAYLAPALQVARLLLRAESLRHDSGDLSAPGFLWKSADVFQDYVGRLLALAGTFATEWDVENGGLRLADFAKTGRTGERAHMQPLYTFPDFRLMSGKQTIAVVDAKYKIWSPVRGPRVADVYQVMAGCRVSNCERAVLVYPSPDGANMAPVTWTPRGAGMPKTVTAAFVNLAAAHSQDGEMSLVDMMASDLRRIWT